LECRVQSQQRSYEGLQKHVTQQASIRESLQQELLDSEVRREDLLKKLQRIKANFPESNLDAFEDIGQDQVLQLQMEAANREIEFKDTQQKKDNQIRDLSVRNSLLDAEVAELEQRVHQSVTENRRLSKANSERIAELERTNEQLSAQLSLSRIELEKNVSEREIQVKAAQIGECRPTERTQEDCDQ